MTEKMDFYGIRDIMNETINEKKAFVPRHGDKESLDNITAQLNEAKMHPCVFLNNHAIGIEAAGDFMKLLNSGEEQYADNDMVDKDLLKNVYNTLKKIYKDEGKKLKESTMFDSVLKESGIEVYPEDGKLKARNIGQQVVSSRTQNKLNPLGTRDVAKPLTPTQKAVTSAVLNILDDKGRASDINSEFDTDPRPDITLMANGDAVITPDGQNRSYKIPANEIDAHMKEARVFPHSSGFGLSGHYDYEEPKNDQLYIATETNDDDGELYFDEKGNTTEFKTDAKKFTSEEDALEFAKNNVIFGEPGTKLLENYKAKPSLKEYFFYAPPHNEEDEEDSIIGYVAAVRDYQTQKTKYVDDNGNVCNSKSQAKVFDTKVKADNYSYDHCPEGWTHFVVALKKSGTLNESNVIIAQWRRDTAERLIKEANKIDPSYSFVEYDIGPKKEIKHKIYKNDNEYVGTFDVFTDEPYNSPYRFFFHHVNIPNVEFQGMDIDEFDKMFKDFITTDKRLGHRALSESSLKENECSLEYLLSKAHISEYKMVSKNSAIVRVHTSPALLTSDSMAARFADDIPDGYSLGVEYLGEDPILGKDLDIYEVQLLKN